MPFSAWKISAPGPQRFGERREADGTDHELLRVEPIVGVRSPVDHVHQGHGQRRRAGAADVAVERKARRLRRRARHRQGDAKNRVRAETALVRRPVELDHDAIDERLVTGVRALELLGDLSVDVRDGLAHALAAVALLVAVPQLQGLAGSRRGARGHAGAPRRSAGQENLDFERRVAARVEDLACVDAFDREAHACVLVSGFFVRPRSPRFGLVGLANQNTRSAPCVRVSALHRGTRNAATFARASGAAAALFVVACAATSPPASPRGLVVRAPRLPVTETFARALVSRRSRQERRPRAHQLRPRGRGPSAGGLGRGRLPGGGRVLRGPGRRRHARALPDRRRPALCPDRVRRHLRHGLRELRRLDHDRPRLRGIGARAGASRDTRT